MKSATSVGARSTPSFVAAKRDVFLCTACHAKSTCRSEVHLNIVRKKCQICGHVSGCFECGPATILERRTSHYGTIGQYRNTKQLQYRKIKL